MAAANSKALAATDLLAKMLTGIPHPIRPAEGEEPTFSLHELRSEGTAVYTTVELPSGDRFKVSVEWDSEASP